MADCRGDWLTERSAGVLLHPTSLHGNEGVGVLGPEACDFVDFLSLGALSCWQILPVGPTGFGNSPYQTFSCFATSPYLICLSEMVEHGLLSDGDLEPLRALPESRVDFGQLYRTKWPVLRHAHRRFRDQKRAYIPNFPIYEEFCETHGEWLLPYARFMALKDRFGGRSWLEWPEEFRSMKGPQRAADDRDLRDSVDFHCFTQYLALGQWQRLSQYARRRGVELIGDMPIFVALDSADIWANRDQFELNRDGLPTVVAGVPPDYFSQSGQLWGNPLYRWKDMAVDGYRWWMSRFAHQFELFDIVRIDHFRGFQAYWEVPADAETAKSGRWRAGPGAALFKKVFAAHPEARIIAEDLGDIDDAVRHLRTDLGLPGMLVLQFAFDGDNRNLYLPHNHLPNAVLYTGTHDNNTTVGWYESSAPELQDQVRRYLRVSGADIAWDFIRAAYRSTAGLCILPMQDLLSLDGESRMNLPGSAEDNWEWRMTRPQFEQQVGSCSYLAELAWLYGR